MTMASRWTTVTFGEVVRLEQGLCFNKKTNHLMAETGIPLLRIADLINNTQTKFVDEERVPKKFIAHQKDIIYSRTGQVGLVFKGKVGVVHNNCFRVIPKDGIEWDYVYWYLRQPSVIQQARSLAGGAAQPDLGHDAFKSISFTYPDLEAQRRIAGILSAYDELIENNQRRIRILEDMARSLYHEWFIYFRYPGHESVPLTDSLLGPIPQGWEVKKLKEVCNLTMGSSPKSEFYNETGEGQPFHQGVTNFGDRFPTDRLFCTVEGRIAEAGDILFSVRAPVGRMNITDKKIIIGRGLSAMRHKGGHQAFLWEQLRAKFTEYDMMGNGAIFASVTKDDMQGIELLFPTEQVVQDATRYFEPLHAEIEVIIKQSANLRQTRDLLLPRLLSGQVSVSADTPPITA